MEKIELASSGRRTSRLGFGCSSLMGSMGKKQSLALLDVAYEAGIRHFDVAPYYGFGQAEACLGEFARRHPGELTITTKYGIPRPKSRNMIGLARKFAAPIVRQFPGIKRRLSNAATVVTGTSVAACFTALEARDSLEESLRQLRMDHVDIFLLHEPVADDLGHEDLLRFLEHSAVAGKFGAFGCGSEASKIAALYEQRRQYCNVLQFEWSVVDAEPDFDASFRIHHRSLSMNLSQIFGRLELRPRLKDELSDLVGLDLGKKENVAALMLKAALEVNPTGVILFSSKSRRNILENARIADDMRLRHPAIRFRDAILSGMLNREEP